MCWCALLCDGMVCVWFGFVWCGLLCDVLACVVLFVHQCYVLDVLCLEWVCCCVFVLHACTVPCCLICVVSFRCMLLLCWCVVYWFALYRFLSCVVFVCW